MDLKEKFNLDLNGVEEINGMMRFNGYYLSEDNGGKQTVLFDNGNLYILKDGEIIKRIEGDDELFIDKQIIKTINNFIVENPKLSKVYSYTASNYNDNIEFYGNPKDEKEGRYLLIRIVINRQSKSIDIPNVMIPFELKHNGFGKKIILNVYQVAQKHKYKLYLVQLVESFYNRMVKRGVKVIVPYDIVEITENTAL